MEEQKKRAGRKWFDITEEDIKKGRTEEFVLSLLREIWLIDGTDGEAASFAKISTSSLSRYLEAHPEEKELRDRLKQNPFIIARQTINKAIKDNPSYAFEYMKRKKKDEFSERNEFTGKDGKDLTVQTINYGDHNASLQVPAPELPATTPESDW